MFRTLVIDTCFWAGAIIFIIGYIYFWAMMREAKSNQGRFSPPFIFFDPNSLTEAGKRFRKRSISLCALGIALGLVAPFAEALWPR
jgi:hypothetical protein